MRSIVSRCCALALIVLTSLSSVKSVAGQPLEVGLRGGGSFSRFGGDDVDGLHSYRSGFTIGALLGYRLTDWARLQTEVTWLQKGAEGTLQGFEEPVAVSLEMDYVQVPLLLGLELPGAGPLRPMLLVGPAVSWESDCDVETSPTELAMTLGCEASAPDGARKSLDWSLVLGGGLGYGSGRWTVFVDGRYDLGLVSLAEPPEPLDVRNRGIMVTAGVILTP